MFLEEEWNDDNDGALSKQLFGKFQKSSSSLEIGKNKKKKSKQNLELKLDQSENVKTEPEQTSVKKKKRKLEYEEHSKSKLNPSRTDICKESIVIEESKELSNSKFGKQSPKHKDKTTGLAKTSKDPKISDPEQKFVKVKKRKIESIIQAKKNNSNPSTRDIRTAVEERKSSLHAKPDTKSKNPKKKNLAQTSIKDKKISKPKQTTVNTNQPLKDILKTSMCDISEEALVDEKIKEPSSLKQSIRNPKKNFKTTVDHHNTLKATINEQYSTKSNTASKSYLSKAKLKLDGARFRWINEQLYTKQSDASKEMFNEDPHLFEIYHQGFESQVKSWPVNPINVIIASIKERHQDSVIADFGCGEAILSRSIPNKVYSFDLIAANEFVTACDMKRVPLDDQSVDVAVFCLSLMGINISDFLKEAHRVTRKGGTLKIAEVVSRFDDLKSFISKVSSMGFRLLSKDTSNKMFVSMDFEKNTKQWNEIDLKLKPCIYKRR